MHVDTFFVRTQKTKHCWGLMKAVSPQRMMYHWGNRSLTSSTGHTLCSHRQKYGQRSALRETDREFPTMTNESKIPSHLSFFFIKYKDFILHKMLQILLWFTECCTFYYYFTLRRTIVIIFCVFLRNVFF